MGTAGYHTGYERGRQDERRAILAGARIMDERESESDSTSGGDGAGEIRIIIDWLPPAGVRGNSRAHWRGKAKAARDLRESGYIRGWEWRSRGGRALVGELALLIRARVKGGKRIDGDNLLIGFKAFIDGLSDSGAIPDDVLISDWRILIERGADMDGADIHICELAG